MIIMGCRLVGLQHIIAGFLKTDIPLIGFDGSNIIPFLVGDDIGMYVFIPQIVRFFNLTLQQAIDLFFYGMVGCSLSLALVGFFLLYKTLTTRIIALAGLSFLVRFLIKFAIQDVYLAYAAASLSIIPLFLYFITKNSSSNIFYGFMLASGIITTTLHYIRAHSALGVIIFITCMILTQHLLPYKKKLLLLGCFTVGLAIPIFYFKSIIHTYKNYAQKEIHDFKEFSTQHPFWHTIYVGFGFLNYFNKDTIHYNDEFAYAKVKKIAPTISHDTNFNEYEKILKNETYLLWKKQPYFFVFTIFAKLGILFLFLLLFAHLGLCISFFWPQALFIELSFWSALACYSIFPLIAVPDFCYCTGFITMATLYGITSINSFLLKNNITTTVIGLFSKNKVSTL